MHALLSHREKEKPPSSSVAPEPRTISCPCPLCTPPLQEFFPASLSFWIKDPAYIVNAEKPATRSPGSGNIINPVLSIINASAVSSASSLPPWFYATIKDDGYLYFGFATSVVSSPSISYTYTEVSTMQATTRVSVAPKTPWGTGDWVHAAVSVDVLSPANPNRLVVRTYVNGACWRTASPAGGELRSLVIREAMPHKVGCSVLDLAFGNRVVSPCPSLCLRCRPRGYYGHHRLFLAPRAEDTRRRRRPVPPASAASAVSADSAPLRAPGRPGRRR